MHWGSPGSIIQFLRHLQIEAHAWYAKRALRQNRDGGYLIFQNGLAIHYSLMPSGIGVPLRGTLRK